MATDPDQLFEFGGAFYDDLLLRCDVLIGMSVGLKAHEGLTEGLQEFKAWIEESFKE